MKINRLNLAVTEIIGVALLLGVSISLFSVVQIIVFSYPFEPSPPALNLVGTIDQGNLLIEHQGGESISLDATILFFIGDLDVIKINASDNIENSTSDNDYMWEIGEIVSYTPLDAAGNPIDLQDLLVKAIVVDKETNSIVMNGIMQEGSS